MPVAAGIAYAEHRGGALKDGHPPLVLIHGAGASRLVWPAQLRRLPGERVLALDLPGHGRSAGAGERSIEAYWSRVAGWMDAIELERAVLAGHSMGGAIALLAALTSSKRIAGLALISTGARLRVDPALLESLSSEQAFRSAADQLNRRWFGDRTPRRTVDLSLRRLTELPQKVVLDDFLASDGFDVMHRLGEINAPTLVLCGLEDQMTPEKYSRYLAYQIRDASLEFVPEAGHMLPLEQPEAVCAAVQRFLKRVFPNQ